MDIEIYFYNENHITTTILQNLKEIRTNIEKVGQSVFKFFEIVIHFHPSHHFSHPLFSNVSLCLFGIFLQKRTVILRLSGMMRYYF